jgi:hypothetical protein
MQGMQGIKKKLIVRRLAQINPKFWPYSGAVVSLTRLF